MKPQCGHSVSLSLPVYTSLHRWKYTQIPIQMKTQIHTCQIIREIDRYGHTNTSIHTNTMWSVSGLIVPSGHVHCPQFAPDVVKVLPITVSGQSVNQHSASLHICLIWNVISTLAATSPHKHIHAQPSKFKETLSPFCGTLNLTFTAFVFDWNGWYKRRSKNCSCSD